MQSRLQKAIGAVKDQTSINLAKFNNNPSSNLQVTILKATTHDDSPINDLYIDQILHLISSNKTHAATCAQTIAKRITQTHNWIVALKSLTLILRIFQDGDPYFPKELLHATKTCSKLLNLSDFSHNSGSNWDYTTFVRTFGLYLDDRLDCFVTGKLQKRYNTDSKRGKSNEYVRDMKPLVLVDRIVHWQRLLERAVVARPIGGARNHQLVKMSLYALVRESFDLYKDISDGLALLLDEFVHLPYESCVSVFRICGKAAKQFQELDKFYSACKNMGVGKSAVYPKVQIISRETIETLEEFLNEKAPIKLLVLPGDELLSKQHKTHEEQSQISGLSLLTDTVSDQASESGSECKPQEDLENITKTSTYSTVDLDDWPANDEQNSRSANSCSGNVTPSSSHTQSNGSEASSANPHKESGSGEDLEVIIPETQTWHHTDILSNTFRASITSALQQPQLSPINNYNPFLQDVHDIPAVYNSASVFEAIFPLNGPFLRKHKFSGSR